MKRFRKLAGYGIVLPAILGLLLCLGATICAWNVMSRLDAAGQAVFQTADEALGFVNDKLNRVSQALEHSRDSVDTMARTATRLQNAGADARQECQTLLQILNAAHQELKSAESWLDSSLAVANGVSRVSTAVLASDFAAARPDAAGLLAAREIRTFADSVTAILVRLQALRTDLLQVLDTGIATREFTLGLIDRLAQLDPIVAGLIGRIEALTGKVATARASCMALGLRLHRWNRAATGIACLVFLWFAASQVVVMAQGWRMRKSSCR